MDIKVGDMVKFFIAGSIGQKKGQVLSITDGMATVWVDKDTKSYVVPVEKLKKI